MMKIVPKRRWVVLLGAAFLVASCDSGPFYDNSYCRLEGDQNKLFCQMGKRMPFFRSGDEVQFIDLCQQVSYDSRSEEHTSELQSRGHLVCRLLLEKKKNEYKLYMSIRLYYLIVK